MVSEIPHSKKSQILWRRSGITNAKQLYLPWFSQPIKWSRAAWSKVQSRLWHWVSWWSRGPESHPPLVVWNMAGLWLSINFGYVVTPSDYCSIFQRGRYTTNQLFFVKANVLETPHWGSISTVYGTLTVIMLLQINNMQKRTWQKHMCKHRRQWIWFMCAGGNSAARRTNHTFSPQGSSLVSIGWLEENLQATMSNVSRSIWRFPVNSTFKPKPLWTMIVPIYVVVRVV